MSHKKMGKPQFHAIWLSTGSVLGVMISQVRLNRMKIQNVIQSHKSSARIILVYKARLDHHQQALKAAATISNTVHLTNASGIVSAINK